MADIDGIPLVTRKEWGARSPRGTTALPVSRVAGCAVHYSASGAPLSHADCDNSVRAIQNYHMDTQGWQDIAYNWLFCRHGYLYRGRGLGIRSAANGTNHANSHFYAICFLGTDNVGRADITPQAKNALTHFLVWLNRQIPGPLEVCPHSKFTSTACPGNELRAVIGAMGWRCKQ